MEQDDQIGSEPDDKKPVVKIEDLPVDDEEAKDVVGGRATTPPEPE